MLRAAHSRCADGRQSEDIATPPPASPPTQSAVLSSQLDQDRVYLEVQGSTYSPNVNCTYIPVITIPGHLRGLYVGEKYRYIWLISPINPKP